MTLPQIYFLIGCIFAVLFLAIYTKQFEWQLKKYYASKIDIRSLFFVACLLVILFWPATIWPIIKDFQNKK
jgi:hypothetical protein